MNLSRAEAEDRLQSAVKKAHHSRLMRLATHPWKLLYPRILRALAVRLPAATMTFWRGRFEAILPEAVSTHIWRYGFFEEDVCLFLLRVLQPGMVFLDIGAHLGFFTLLGSELVGQHGKVVAFEPMPGTFAQLVRNVSLNGRLSNTVTVNSAAYSTNANLTFLDYGLIDAGLDSAFGPRNHTDSIPGAQEVIVDARRLDDVISTLQIPRVDVIKIDAESSEMHVLRGAEATIDEFRPKIILEVGDFDLPGVASSAELVEWLRLRDYVPHQYTNGRITSHQRRDKYRYGNLLFIRDTT